MAEDIRSLRKILEELFKGSDAALEKYAKVRRTLYEINLWYQYGLPLREVPRGIKFYFSQRFLCAKKIESATEAELDEAMTRLRAAVNIGCKGRCERLVGELNLALEDCGLRIIEEPDKFLDWLTFDYELRKDYEGNPLVEKPYGFPIISGFDSDRNRKEFWGELQLLLNKYGRMMSMQDVEVLVLIKRRNSVVLRD